MNRRLRIRVEAGLAAVAAVLAVVSIVWPTWLESIVGDGLDHGDGAAEWWMVAMFAAIAVAFAVAARVERRRLSGVT